MAGKRHKQQVERSRVVHPRTVGAVWAMTGRSLNADEISDELP